MARKRIRNVESSNDSNDGSGRQEGQMGTCPHVGKGIDIGSVKKAWKKKDEVTCQQCRKRHVVSKKEASCKD
ncbi:hypothetical protein J437_LFUL014485 [Ladona fulva]|uniref:Uncharacterized protein n=1 Tax=Ladona fulva TaxID=123851 RepID=A0A8K0P632_LADFU|nr:hypothetical protein J437_LFUL014485 [Ladona fulva]